VQRLLLDALAAAGVTAVRLDVGHVGVFRALVRRAGIGTEREGELFQAVQAKDSSGIAQLVRRLEPGVRRGFERLPALCGDARVLAAARRDLPRFPEVRRALDQLSRIARDLRGKGVQLSFDLGELRGYHYHSGVVFAAYTDGWPNALALGGRYDEVGKAFGRARPATGFTMDLRDLVAAIPAKAHRRGIVAPYAPRDAALARRIGALRSRGEVVVVELPGHAGEREGLNCDRRLARRAGRWVIERLR
jgi:ATP phosphoribosyltransferase regulatory subunit